MWILVLEGLLIGGLLGLTGAGGGILAVPALMASQGWSVAQAAPIGLLAVTLSACIGMLQGLIKQIVRYKAALWIALISIPAAKYGIYLAKEIPALWLTLGFSLIMFWIAYRLLSNKINDFENAPCKVDQATGRFIWNFKTATILGGIGLVAGLMTGLLGVGGGFVIVPALRKATDLDMKSIVATSLMVIFLIGGISITINILEGFHYPANITLSFVLACILGMLIGRKITTFVSIQKVQTIFAITLIFVASYLIYSIKQS